MSINAADILRQLHVSAEAVRTGKLDPDSAQAIASLATQQVNVLRTVVDYLKITKDQELTQISTDVFVGTEQPKGLTHDSAAR